MHDEHPHHLLAQLPLTVSPFLSLPTATPLPYTYKQLPSTLPPSILNPTNNTDSSQQQQQAAYIISQTGQTASTPDAILTSCHALQSHLQQLETDARRSLQEWEERRRLADLAEKRRVAPGWLDGDVKLLVPENVVEEQQRMKDEESRNNAENRPEPERRKSVGIKGLVEARDGVPDPTQAAELDRVFGGLDIK